MKKNLVLIGMPGCGKSTLGVLAAKALGMDFLDTDILLQKTWGKTLQRVVDELGKEGFYREEERAVKALRTHNTLIATGGSVAMENEAIKRLRENGLVVFLHLPYETIETRLGNIKTRGIAMDDGETLRDLYDLRQPAYRRWAHETLETDGLSVEQAVDELTALAMAHGIGQPQG